jgi:hypothetical protein
MNINVSREQAICMLFCVEYNNVNVAGLVKRINDMKDIDVCYETDPCEPILISLKRIYGNPLKYHRYSPSSAFSGEHTEHTK